MKKNIKKNKNLPLVTVIIPTYNRAGFLEETILSIRNQDYPNIECIVLDDGSTDSTIKIMKKYRKKIIGVSHNNMGEVRTVNKGFLLSHGEIIGVVNSDDPLLPGAIGETVKFMMNNPKIIVVYPDWIKIDENGSVIERVITPEYDYIYMLKTHDCVPGPGTFFKRIVIDKLKGRDARYKYVSDYDFWLRTGLIGEFARLPKFLATWRSHRGSATYKHKGYKMAMEHFWVINKLFSRPNLPSHIKKAKSEAYLKACEAARICRGSNFGVKILVFFASLYYSPFSYMKIFILYRLARLQKLASKLLLN